MSGAEAGYVQLVYAPAGAPASPYGWQDAAFVEYYEGVNQWVADDPGWMLGLRTGISATEAGRFDGRVVSLAGITAGRRASYAVFGAAGGVDDAAPVRLRRPVVSVSWQAHGIDNRAEAM